MRRGSRWGARVASARKPEVRFITLSGLVKLAFPPLFLSSIPKRAIGFSFPSGSEGRVLGLCLLGMTAVVGYLLFRFVGPLGFIAMAWLTGGTGSLMLYNSTNHRVAFVKDYCSACRLRPLIEEHELMHLNGERSEEVVWAEARKKYSYESLGLEGDARICSFCPIAKRLRNNPEGVADSLGSQSSGS
ncbi:MAG: hypothetical protein OK474_11540 [Thaumarchaeota archaeon]|nr:hypothetical protein [Nitrososphaerota archaeon]